MLSFLRLHPAILGLLCLMGSFVSVRAEPEIMAQSALGPKLPMSFIYRSVGAGCTFSCPRWLEADGTITAETPALLRAELSKRKVPIFFNSVGGNVDAALEMGRIIREAGVDTVVARMAVHGRPQPGYCLSSCTFAFAAGKRRFAPADARIGVHRVKSTQQQVLVQRRYRVLTQTTPEETITSRELVDEKRTTRVLSSEGSSPALTARLKTYLATMGVSNRLQELMDSTAHKDIRLLFQLEMEETNLVTHFANAMRTLEMTFDEIKPTAKLPASRLNLIINAREGARHSFRAQLNLVRREDEEVVTMVVTPLDKAFERAPRFPLSKGLRFLPALQRFPAIDRQRLRGPVVMAFARQRLCSLSSTRIHVMNVGATLRGMIDYGTPVQFPGDELLRGRTFFSRVCNWYS